MKAAVIGAGEESLYTINKAHEYGIEIIALDGNPKAEGLDAADTAMAVDISKEDAVIGALKKEQPDFVLTAPIGRYLTTVGAVNDALGLPGISREMAVLCTDKFLFHQRMQEQKLRMGRCYYAEGGRITDVSGRIYQGEKEIGEELLLTFPAILKPRYGSGSRGIYILNSRKQLMEALEAVSGEAYVLEECAQGEEYGADGAVIGEQFYLVLLRKKENTPLPARQAVGYFSVSPSDGLWQEVQEYMEKTVVCLGLKECLFHADIIKTERGLFAVEMSARPSGHNLHNFFTPLCTGVDVVEEYIRHRIGLPCHFETEKVRPMLIHYFDLQGKVKQVPNQEEVQEALSVKLVEWKCRIREGEELAPVTDGHSLMGRGFFVLEGGDKRELRRQAEKVKSFFQTE
ncbi:MAG: ATP-grasp domain-containing protein [Lachnospiraceae bacterium]|nr:ATP-grasp domain-containing protein [Lachnospiraceae bacterium]